MKMTLNDFRDEMKEKYPADTYLKTMSELSDGLVSDDRRAYDFDAIKNYWCPRLKITSADALAIGGKAVYLIEFKSGFSGNGYSCPEEEGRPCTKVEDIKKEEQKKAIRIKAIESLLLLERVLCDHEEQTFAKRFIAVIDGGDDVLGVQEDFYREKASQEPEKSHSIKNRLLKEMTEESLLVYRKEINGKHIMFDDVAVVYSFEYKDKTKGWY